MASLLTVSQWLSIVLEQLVTTQNQAKFATAAVCALVAILATVNAAPVPGLQPQDLVEVDDQKVDINACRDKGRYWCDILKK
ncbi:hypothetical protein BGZ94_008103 [Podila epigama]|nr:hypothetical protein BGZ94_008103 [Podila epigama]